MMKLLCKLPIEPFLLLRFNTANNIIHQWTSWNSLLTHSTHSICFNSQAYTKTRSNQLITPCLCCALNHSHCDWVSLNWTKSPHTGILGSTSTCVNHYHIFTDRILPGWSPIFNAQWLCNCFCSQKQTQYPLDFPKIITSGRGFVK